MKIYTLEELLPILAQYKQEQKKIVFTNGCFDILHAGHVRYLRAARSLGDCLIVGLNSDSSVQALKGLSRPVNTQDDRAEVLAGLAAVDYIIVFPDATAEKLVITLQPDIYVKGGDYVVEQLPEAKHVLAYGGVIELIPEVKGRSTTATIQKMQGR